MPRPARGSPNFVPKYDIWGNEVKKVNISQEEREKKEAEELKTRQQSDRLKILSCTYEFNWRHYDYQAILDSWIAYYKDDTNTEKHPKDRVDLGDGLSTFPEKFSNHNCLVELEHVKTVNDCMIKINIQRMDVLKEDYLQKYGVPFNGAVGYWEKEENDKRAFEAFKQRTKNYNDFFGINKTEGGGDGKPCTS